MVSTHFTLTFSDGTTVNKNTPVISDFRGVLKNKTVVSISSGYAHVAVLTADGQAYAWGSNVYGQIGVGITWFYITPTTYKNTAQDVVSISGGPSHTVAITSTGLVYAWGDSSLGLGDGKTLRNPYSIEVDKTGVLAGKVVTKVVAGALFTIVQTEDGLLAGWGYNGHGQLGDGTTTTSRSTPVLFSLQPIVLGIATGYTHTVVLATNGSVYTCGSNTFGEIGDNTLINRLKLVPVYGIIANETIIAIDAGYYNTFAVSSTGKVYSWGFNQAGQLGGMFDTHN